MQSTESVLVWSLNKRLVELKRSNDNIKDAIREYYKFNERNYSLPLKIVIDEIYYDLNIPIEIINLITIYNSGGIVYNYSKRFQQHTQNTIYILPILFGYLETFLFFLFCILAFIPHINGNILLIVSLLFAILLIIHGTCALLSYHKCKDYEIVIRNFKKALYNNDNFIQHLKSINNIYINMDHATNNNNDTNYCNNKHEDGNKDLLTTNQRAELIKYENDYYGSTNIDTDTNWHWSSNTELKDNKTYQIILNPSNNSFAYVAYQRWSNVKYLELKNDSFTRSKAALTLSLGKYWIPSYFILSIIMVISTPVIVSIIWWIIYIHSFYVLLYCYLRVVKNVSHRNSLIVTILATAFQDIVIVIIVIVLVITDQNNDGDADTDSSKKALDVILPIIFSICGLLYLKWLMQILYNTIKYNRDTAAHSLYKLWWYSYIVSCNIYFLFLAPSWRIIGISMVFFVLMLISCYMNMQQLIHRIMTGLKKREYINAFIANDPQYWLKQEMKLLFIPYIK